MSVASRIAAGALQRVGWYLAHGYDRSQYHREFGPMIQGENWNTVEALWVRGYTAYLAGQNAMAGAGSGYVPDSQIPGRGPGRTNYRYTVQYTYRMEDGSPDQTRRHTFVSPFLVNRTMLDAEGDRIRQPYVPPSLGKPRSPVITVRDTLVGADVITLERWT